MQRRWAGRRAWRPWVGDVAVVVLSGSIGLLGLRLHLLVTDAIPPWLALVDAACGVLAALALGWRRRFPVAVAALVIALSAGAESAATPALVALFAVAVRCSTRVAVTTAAASLLATAVFAAVRMDSVAPLWLMVPLTVAGPAAALAWGLLVRSRRQLVASLRERAAAAEVEAALRAERAQHEARETLAREMHDVLGHRLSLLSVHAGALAFHRDAPAEQTARAAEVVRENAHRALQDLREVIGVLRAPVGELPLPGVGDIAELIEETSRAGTPVELCDGHGVTTGGPALPETVGRTLYRFVQESLTNARRHAPGAPVVVRITGEPGDHVAAEVENPRPTGSHGAPAAPAGRRDGSGEGLRGLAERAALVGGRLDHGPTASGGWRVGVRLPWPA